MRAQQADGKPEAELSTNQQNQLQAVYTHPIRLHLSSTVYSGYCHQTRIQGIVIRDTQHLPAACAHTTPPCSLWHLPSSRARRHVLE